MMLMTDDYKLDYSCVCGKGAWPRSRCWSLGRVRSEGGYIEGLCQPPEFQILILISISIFNSSHLLFRAEHPWH
jgi:hypothetical protein